MRLTKKIFVYSVIIFFNAAFAFSQTDGTPSYLTGLLSPVLLRFSDNITFYHNLDNGTVANMAGVESKPFGVEGKTSFETTEEGKDSLSGGALKFHAEGNLDLVRQGTLIFWIRPFKWVRSDNEPNFYPLFVYARNGYIMLGRQGKIVEKGVAKRHDMIFLYAYGKGNKIIGRVLYHGATTAWKDEWHMIALTWQTGRIGISIDGSPASTTILEHEMGEASWFQFGSAYPLAEGSRILMDELMIFNRNLTDEEIDWIYKITTANGSKKHL